MSEKRFLSIDYGEKFIGVASFRQNMDPFPLMEPRIKNDTINSSFQALLTVVKEEYITDIIWGIPHLLDGSRTKMTEKIEKVGMKFQEFLLNNKSETLLQFFDETLSTYQAKEIMKSSPQFNFQIDLRQIDSLSAKVILEDFLKIHR